MATPALQYYLHDEPDAFRLELSGRLSGAGAESIYHAWRTALSIIGGRLLIVDVTFVQEADELGRALLRIWHRTGARIIAASPESCALAESIVGEPLPQAPAKPRFFERWRNLFRRLSTRAAVSADASEPHARSASAAQKLVANTAIPERRRVDCHLP